MRRIFGIGSMVFLVVGLFTFINTVFTVDETTFAVVQQFGDIKRVETEPGLNFKLPFVQDVTYLNNRVLTLDTPPQEYLTDDQKRIVVDQVTRWKISEPRAFFLAVRTEAGGRGRLEPLVLASLRERIAAKPYDVMISAERDVIMDVVKADLQVSVNENRLGVEIIDVRTKRADLPVAVEQSVFDRMESARRVESAQHRALGQLLSDQITAQTDREVQIMLACADRVSQETRGDGEAAAIAIFAEALQQGPEFYSFLRRLEAYETAFDSDDNFIFSTDSNFFALLTGVSSPLANVEASTGDVVPLSPDITAALTQDEINLLIEECTPPTVIEISL